MKSADNTVYDPYKKAVRSRTGSAKVANKGTASYMVCIFDYQDYRSYLQDYYDQKKAEKGMAYSHRSFSRLAGFRSPNMMQLVMTGKRNLTHESVENFVKGLRLDDDEAEYFRDMVLFTQAKTESNRELYKLKLDTVRHYRAIKELEADELEYYRHWYYSAIWELARLPSFKADPEWIATKLCPEIGVEEAKNALELLLRLGFLKEENGKVVQAELHISTSQEISSGVVKKYHREMIGRASDAIDSIKGDKREISSLTVAVSKESFQEAKRRIQEFRRELNILLSKEENPDAVYQINFQMFNLSDVDWDES